MRAHDCKVLLCATAIILSCVSSGAEARYWRHYGAIIGMVVVGTVFARTAMSVRLRDSSLARNQEMSLATKAISARLSSK